MPLVILGVVLIVKLPKLNRKEEITKPVAPKPPVIGLPEPEEKIPVPEEVTLIPIPKLSQYLPVRPKTEFEHLPLLH